MKRILIALCFMASLKASSQKIDTANHSITIAPINSIIYRHGFPVVTDTLTYLGYFYYQDDSRGNCTVPYALVANGVNKVLGSYKLTSEEYAAWNGSAEGLLRIIALVLNVSFK